MALLQTFEGKTCPEVWLRAAQYVAEVQRAYNVILAVESASCMTAVDFGVWQALDRFLREHDGEPLATVASSVFPGDLYLRSGAEALFRDFPAYESTIRGRWDGYASRMLSKTLMIDGSSVSPLENIVNTLKKNAGRAGQNAIYEIGIEDPHDSLSELPIYRADPDARQLLGRRPCLTHLSFKKENDRVHLTALYRSHYYVQKVLGNLVGLAQLQQFVAEQTGLQAGVLVCHSTYATFDTDKWTRTKARELLSHCARISRRAVSRV